MEKIEQLRFELVFTETRKVTQAIPLTRSDVIANQCGIDHNSVKSLIELYKDKFDEFSDTFKKGIKQSLDLKSTGRNSTSSYKTWYNLNEKQTNFLITLLKNTPQVVELKFKLVKEFNAMREILLIQEMERRMGKEQRRLFTDAIQEKFGNEGIVYAEYTNLCYTLLFGRTAIEIKNDILEKELDKCTTIKERNRVLKDIAKLVRDYFTDKELADIKKIESECATLIRLGMSKNDIYNALKTLYPQPTYILI
ncbi:Rha family transcriptional regulator [Sarcina ventriculi]|uniref:Rha family transcriptional regulator n=1 Tax=Sarcina ventriculi TaxID=1267 RepID=UPI00073E401B|nr:Rha family transcriptional regulator [Sarcina ventriculi]